MSGSTRHRWQRTVAPLAAATLAGTFALAGQSAAVAATAAAAPAGSSAGGSAVAGVITLRSTATFPTASPGGSPSTARARGHSAASLQGLVNRSHSPRPTSRTIFPAAGPLAPPTVRPTAVIAGTPGLQRSFEGLNAFDQRTADNGNQFTVEPPDQGLCAGNGYVLETVNDVIRAYTTSGTPVTAVTSLNRFYGYPSQINRTNGQIGPFVTDPSCLFDQTTRRFYVVVLTLDVNPKTGAFTMANHLDIAVSRSANPAGGWVFYSIPAQDNGAQGTPRHAGCPCLGDFPHIGADAHGFFITTNEYPFSNAPGRFGNNYNGAQIYAMSKRLLAAGASRVPFVHFQNTFLRSQGTTYPGFSVWPTQVPDQQYATAHNGTEYFISSIAGQEARPTNFTGFANQVGVWQVTNTASLDLPHPAPRLAGALIDSQVYGVPPQSMQKVGPVPLRDCLVVTCLPGLGPSSSEVEGGLDSSDSRMLTAWYAGGQILGALDTVMQVNGNLQAGPAWFSVKPGNTPARSSITRQGYLGVAGNNVIYPAVATNPAGDGVMALTLVGKGYYPSAAYAPMSLTGPGPVSVAGMGQAPQDGFCEYLFFNCGGTSTPSIRPRWGDYGAAVYDQGTIWTGSEYIAASCSFAEFRNDPSCGGTRAVLANWSTRVSQITP